MKLLVCSMYIEIWTNNLYYFIIDGRSLGLFVVMARGKKDKKKQQQPKPKKESPPMKDPSLRRINEATLPKVTMDPLPAACCIACGCSRPQEDYPPEAVRVMAVSIRGLCYLYKKGSPYFQYRFFERFNKQIL